jgi:hypothetical protein
VAFELKVALVVEDFKMEFTAVKLQTGLTGTLADPSPATSDVQATG